MLLFCLLCSVCFSFCVCAVVAVSGISSKFLLGFVHLVMFGSAVLFVVAVAAEFVVVFIRLPDAGLHVVFHGNVLSFCVTVFVCYSHKFLCQDVVHQYVNDVFNELFCLVHGVCSSCGCVTEICVVGKFRVLVG